MHILLFIRAQTSAPGKVTLLTFRVDLLGVYLLELCLQGDSKSTNAGKQINHHRSTIWRTSKLRPDSTLTQSHFSTTHRTLNF